MCADMNLIFDGRLTGFEWYRLRPYRSNGGRKVFFCKLQEDQNLPSGVSPQ